MDVSCTKTTNIPRAEGPAKPGHSASSCKICTKSLNFFLLQLALASENRSFLVHFLYDLAKKLISVAVGQNMLVVLGIGNIKT